MKEETKVEIKSINIKIGDTKLNLSMDEAKKLHEALADMFGKKVVEHHYTGGWWYNYPIYIGTQPITTVSIGDSTTTSAGYTLTTTNTDSILVLDLKGE